MMITETSETGTGEPYPEIRKKCMCSAAVRAEDTLYSDNDEFRAVRHTDSSGIATVKDKGAGFTERTWKR